MQQSFPVYLFHIQVVITYWVSSVQDLCGIFHSQRLSFKTKTNEPKKQQQKKTPQVNSAWAAVFTFVIHIRQCLVFAGRCLQVLLGLKKGSGLCQSFSTHPSEILQHVYVCKSSENVGMQLSFLQWGILHPAGIVCVLSTCGLPTTATETLKNIKERFPNYLQFPYQNDDDITVTDSTLPVACCCKESHLFLYHFLKNGRHRRLNTQEKNCVNKLQISKSK